MSFFKKATTMCLIGICALTGNSFANNSNENIENNHIQQLDKKDLKDDNNLVNSRTHILNWSNTFMGETSTTFNYYETHMDLR